MRIHTYGVRIYIHRPCPCELDSTYCFCREEPYFRQIDTHLCTCSWWMAQRLSASPSPIKVELRHEFKAMIIYSLPRKERATKESPRPTSLDLRPHPKHPNNYWITVADSGTYAYSGVLVTRNGPRVSWWPAVINSQAGYARPSHHIAGVVHLGSASLPKKRKSEKRSEAKIVLSVSISQIDRLSADSMSYDLFFHNQILGSGGFKALSDLAKRS